jgi:spore germination protein YaaH
MRHDLQKSTFITITLVVTLLAALLSAQAACTPSQPAPSNGTPAISLQSPNGGEFLSKGSAYDIKWSYKSTAGEKLEIDLIRDKQTTIIAEVPGDPSGNGTYRWTVPAGLEGGTMYKIRAFSKTNPSASCESASNFTVIPVSKVTYGFWPYWVPYSGYQPDWDGLSYLCYFSLEATANGTLGLEHMGSDYYAIRNQARSHTTKVPLALTCFDLDIQDAVLANHQVDLVKNIKQKLVDYEADGICIDFEGVRDTNSITRQPNTPLVLSFMKSLYETLKAANPKYHISFCTLGDVETVYWNSELAKYADTVFLMGYDYHWSEGPTTGSISPYNNPSQLDIIQSVNKLKGYYPKEKIIAGLPFYGYDWPCSSANPGAKTSGKGAIVFMSAALENAGKYDKHWDKESNSPWYSYQSKGVWHQCWYEDVTSLSMRFDYIITENLAGPGFWALGFEGNNTALWKAIKQRFSRK